MISKKAKDVMGYLDTILPNASCELNYSKDYELVIAVMLSAQTTDKAVNKATAVLFTKYPTLSTLASAPIEEIENCIRFLGLYKNKAKNVKAIAQTLVNEFDSIVPRQKEKLMVLPGVGNKTANVIRCEIFKENEFPVDTHIERISKRLGFASIDDSVSKVEQKLRRAFPQDKYILLHHQLIHFGRYYCKALSPQCETCPLKVYCNFKKAK